MENAIKKAIEGGWRPRGLSCEGYTVSWIKQAAVNRSKFSERYLLDPLFWQTLGKAMGWNSEIGDSRIGGSPSHEWKQQRNRFTDHLDKGGNVDEFFKELTK